MGCLAPLELARRHQGSHRGYSRPYWGLFAPGPRFAWSDGIFLKALRAGDWVLLDELNLASQSVLEGLNACLDHRGTVYIPEIDKCVTSS